MQKKIYSDLWVNEKEPLPHPEHLSKRQKTPDGLIAISTDLSAKRLIEAYSKGIYPWYEADSPVIQWWSPDPRMVLYSNEFSLKKSLKKKIKKVTVTKELRLSINSCFNRVIDECSAPQCDRQKTWIDQRIKDAYSDLHKIGLAHSVEVWISQEHSEKLCAGLYGVSIGRMFFGESMFTRETDASKIALFSLVSLLEKNGFELIDCQQDTAHLSSLGARTIARDTFLERLSHLTQLPPPDWSSFYIELPKV